MVILFSGRKSATERELIKILTGCGASYISDKAVSTGNGIFTIVSEYKKTDLNLENGVAVFLDDTERFSGQSFPNGMIGICEDTNKTALSLFKENNIPVISCGMGSKNTVTLSSLNSSSLLASLQRTVTDCKGNDIFPGEFKIKLSEDYTPFAVMAAAAVLLLNGITPESF